MVTAMRYRAVWIVIATALTSLLFASVTTAGEVAFRNDSVSPTASVESTPSDLVTASEFTPDSPDRADPGSARPIPAWIVITLAAIVSIVGLAYAAMIAVTGWRHRPRLRWHARLRGTGQLDALPDVAAAVTDEAEAQRAELLAGEPRNAIVRCWLRLEHDVASVGLVRHPSDTSAEFTERVLARYSVDGEAIGALAALYREARFSRHELGETSRQAALDALERLHHDLGEVHTDAAPAAAR